MTTLDARKHHMQFIEWNKNPSNLLSRGPFGNFYIGKLLKSQLGSSSSVSVKVTHSLTNLEDEQRFMNEIEIMCKMNHPCCCSLIAWDFHSGSDDPTPVPREGILVSEFFPLDLDRLLVKVARGQRHIGFTPTKKSCIAFEIAFGMAYLHKQNIIHFHLKPSNIFLDENLFARVGDFELSKVVNNENRNEIGQVGGTPVYMAPELDMEGYGPNDITGAVDVFAFGMILWEMAVEMRPFANVRGILQIRMAICEGQRPALPQWMGDGMKELITRCGEGEYEKRPSFEEIVNHREWLVFDGTDEGEYSQLCRDLVQKHTIE
jgi:serine/threonine protein kinase